MDKSKITATAVLCFVIVGLVVVTIMPENEKKIQKGAMDRSPSINDKKPENLTFFVLGDWGTRGLATDVAAAMALEAAKKRPTAIISTGDNIYDKTVRASTDPQFRILFEDVFNAETIRSVPWLMSLGDHDHDTPELLQAELDYAQAHPTKWEQPFSYYTLKIGEKVQFFVLDAYEEKKDRMAPPQLTWLENELKTSTALWKIVIGHRPVFSGGHAHGNSHWLQETLAPLLRRYHVQAHFSGDDHSLQVLNSEGVRYFVSGAGGVVSSHLSKIPETRFRY